MLGIVRTEIAEGGLMPEDCWLCIANVFGYHYPGMNRDDYQGWLFRLKLPAYEWFEEGLCSRKATWGQRVLLIRHVWLGNGRRGINGAGWQGWRWSLAWMPCN